MQEQLVTFETAKLAKEKGFDWKCRTKLHCSHYHMIKDNIIPDNIPTYQNDMFAPIKDWNNYLKPKLDTETSLPTQTQLQKWFREVHKIDIYIIGYGFGYYPQLNNVPPAKQGDVKYVDRRWNMPPKEEHADFRSWEEALEVALQEALKLI